MSTAPTLLPADAAADQQCGVISGSIAVGSAVAARWQRWQHQLAGSESGGDGAATAVAAQGWRAAWRLDSGSGQRGSGDGDSTAAATAMAVQ